MSNTTTHPLRDTLVEVMKLHRKAMFQAEGATTGTSPKVSGSKAGSSDLYFRADDLPLAVEMERFYRRAADYWERRVERQNAPSAFRKDSRSEAKRDQTRAILAEVGVDPTTVAFIYSSTTEAVKKARGRAGLDPNTGQAKRALRQERVDGKPTTTVPLTAPPSAVIAGLEALAGESPDR